MKRLILFILISVYSSVALAQGLNMADLLKLTNSSHKEANQYLTSKQKFKCISSNSYYGQTVSQYSKKDELIIKDQWQDGNKIIPSIHYSFKSKIIAGSLIEELKKLSFRLKEDNKDKNKHVLLYENDQYTVSIYSFSNKNSSIELEIHGK